MKYWRHGTAMSSEFDWLLSEFGEEPEEKVNVADPVERRKQLEALKERGGTWAQLATEALASMDDREKARAQEALVAEADELTVEGIAELVSAFEAAVGTEEAVELGQRVDAVKDALRAQVEA